MPDLALVEAAVRDALARPDHSEDAGAFGRERSPWHAWLLVCLMRQVPLQRWLVDVVESRLRAPDAGEEGAIPAMPGWRYGFHGRGCRFVSPEDETLDVDFYGDGGLTIDLYFFADRIASLRAPALPEARLRALLPTRDSVVHAARELRAAGLLTAGANGHGVRLPPSLEALADVASRADFGASSAREAWAARLGDGEYLADDARAARSRAARVAYFESMLDGSSARVAIEPLEALLDDEAFVALCGRVIDGPVGAAAGEAIERLAARPSLPFCAAVGRLIGRMSPVTDHPYAMHEAARYLLRRGVQRERAVAAFLPFARVDVVPGYNGNPFLGDFALLALEFAPSHALELVRAALRGATPVARQKAIATLSLLDAPWCHRALAAALVATREAGARAELRAALARSQSDTARSLAAPEGLPAASPGGDPGFTWEDFVETNANDFLSHEVEALRERVEALRGGLPDDLDSVVWA